MRSLITVLALLCAACATYVTPGGGAPLQQLNRADIAEGSARQPAPQLPASVAMVRLQASPYRSYTAEGRGSGRFSVIAESSAPPPAALQTVSRWPSVESATALQSAWLPERLESLDDLRGAAAKMQADVLLVYTVDTRFELAGKPLAADASIPLGAKGEGPVAIRSKASLAFVDVRTGYVYGAVDGEARIDAADTASREALDRQRLNVENDAVTRLLAAAAETWSGLVQQYQ